MSSTQKDIVNALINALISSNRYMEEFIGESPELCAQFEDNEDLIQMIGPDLETVFD